MVVNEETPMEVAAEPAVDAESVSIIADDWQNYGEVEVPPAPEKVATYDTNGPRLMISQIVNEDFKSYAGVKTLGPFHKSFTCIVGPNGSGKSNVIDSMLFVFGYRANKIRSKKISVLIHNSDQHNNLTSCSVAVHFQKIIDTGSGQDDFEVIPNSQFVVSRTAFKDNSSYYSLNGKKAPYKDVAAVLRGNGIDLDHNRFLILQGEVEQIAMMKPKAQTEHDEGMLEFLEDIIGSSRFKEPIELLAKRVENLSEIRGEKLNRVKVVEKEKNDLEGPKNEAMEYLSMENDITKLKNKLYQKYIHECTVNEDKAVKKRDEIKDGMKEVTAKLEEINNSKKERVKSHKKIFKEYEHLEKECDKRKEEFSEFEQQDVKCREDLKHAKLKAKKLEKSLEQEKKKVEELKQVPEKSEKEIEKLKVDLEKHQAQLKLDEAKLQEVMESLKTETQGLQAQKDAKETELLGMQKSVNETKSKMDVAQSELDIYLSNQKNETEKLKTVQKNLESTQSTLKDRKDGIKYLEKKIPENESALSKAQKDLTAASEAEAKLNDEVKETRVKVERARSSMEANKSRNKVLNALMEQKRCGKLPGIYGRLGDLGAIDEKYDVAISTACGPLDNIVCDTIDTAQKCVEFLKKNNIGWATFIAVDKMARWKEHVKRKIQTPENVPRLFDLIKVQDEKVLTVFYHALRDTLVAKDLEQATRISYGKQRYRVVSMGGQLIETSGTMSGGGSRVSKGRMGSAVVDDVNPKELQDMEKRLQKNSQDIQSIRENKEKLDNMVVKLTKELKEMKHTLDKYNMEIKHLEEQEASLVTQEKEQTERVKAAAPDAKELQQLQKKVDAFKKDYEKVANTAKVVQDAVKALHKEIMDITNSKMSSAQKKVDHVSNLIDQVTGQITKAGVAVKTAKRNQKKAEDKVKSLEEETTENEQSVVDLEKLFKKLEEDATKVLEAFQAAQEKMKESEVALEEVKTAVAALEKEENDLQKDHIEVKHELEKYETVVKDSQMKIKHWKKELGKISLHAIDGEEQAELPVIPEEDLESISKEETQYEITVNEEKIAKMKPNMAAIEEFKKKEGMYLKRVSELDEVTDVRDQQRRLHESLRKQRLDEFMAGFGIITYKLKEMYQMITLGGDAELELVDSLDPFSEGIVFSVRPPKKSWKNISNLSGGEKTLSSLALVFALHHFKPTPLYVMDEIDAALDFRNVSIVAHYIKERTKNAQFIIISLRNNMFELSDRLVGIYKTNNCTQTVAINPHTYSNTVEPCS